MLTMVAVLPEPPLLVSEPAIGASAGTRRLHAAAPHHVAVWTPAT